MKSLAAKTCIISASLVLYSHAIFGVGGHWAPSTGLEVKGSKGTVGPAAAGISLEQASVKGLNGIGGKVWLDFLPFIDAEVGTDIQWGFYDVSVIHPGGKIDLTYDMDLPMVDEKPAFARILFDGTVKYPFLKLPPVVSLAKFSVGAGITYALATEVLNTKFAEGIINNAEARDPSGFDSSDPNEVSQELIKAITKEGLTQGMGFHLVLGATVKPPIIPLAVYADAKYHILSSMPSGVDANSITFELGGALAF